MKSFRFNKLKGVLGVLAGALSLSAATQSVASGSAWFEHEHGAVRLIAAGASAGSAERVALGLQFRMKPGWKVYWRSPGDAGFPPQLNWAGSRNFAGAEMSWPAPERFSVLGLETLGYKNEVVFPITATPFEPGKAMAITAQLRFLTCDDICVPYETTLALDLPAGADINTPESGVIAAWRAKVPAAHGAAVLGIDEAQVAGDAAAPTLVVRATAREAFRQPDLFVEGPADYGFRKPVVRIAATGTEALMRIDVQAPKKPGPPLVGETVTLTLVDGDRAVERRLALTRATGALAVPAGPASDGGGRATGYGLLVILGFALLGGLILNLMPCVLPVLSIKLLAIVSHGGAAPARIRAGFLASSAGIVACFLVLGTVAVALREAGLAAGWGIQFQQPVFLAFMVTVITLFACNMWGLFEIRLPGAVADAAAGAGGGDSLGGHFLTGAFATLLATPCTAPFLGTAVGFALSRGAAEIYLVFAALGLGLALPWILVAAFPALVNRLPKPGRWMVTFKRLLSVALVGTALWLLSVLWLQIGGAATVMIGMLMVAIAFSIWQFRYLSDRARFATWVVVAVLSAIAMVGAGSFGSAVSTEDRVADGNLWKPFDLARIRQEVGAGNTVLVDVTAEWCLTCQVNKSLVLNRGPVRDIIGSGAIIAMKADWTKPDPKIANYLKNFGRFGIPFNVVYGPRVPDGVPLPEILTDANVLAALKKAGGKAVVAGR